MASKIYKFLPEDYSALLDKISNLKKKVIKFGQEMGESTEQSSETYHDNATYDVARSNFEITSKYLEELLEIKKRSKIIDPTKNSSEKVSIGRVVKILNLDTQQIRRLKITGDVIE